MLGLDDDPSRLVSAERAVVNRGKQTLLLASLFMQGIGPIDPRRHRLITCAFGIALGAGACLAERLFEKLHVNDEKLLPRFSPRNDLRRRGADQAALLPWGAPG